MPLDKEAKTAILFIAASIIIPTVILIALLAMGTDAGIALLYGIFFFGLVPPVVLVAYLLLNKSASRLIRTRTSIVILIVTGALLGLCAITSAFAFGSQQVTAELGATELQVNAPFVNEHIQYSSITSVELRNDVNYGTRTWGYAGGTVLSGSFRNSEFGDYTLAVFRSPPQCIVVHHAGAVLVFNLDSSAGTAQFFADLQSRLPV
jgi:hypothetical protein